MRREVALLPVVAALVWLELARAQAWTDRYYKPNNAICMAAGDVHMVGFNTAPYDMQGEGLYDMLKFDPGFSLEAVQVRSILVALA